MQVPMHLSHSLFKPGKMNAFNASLRPANKLTLITWTDLRSLETLPCTNEIIFSLSLSRREDTYSFSGRDDSRLLTQKFQIIFSRKEVDQHYWPVKKVDHREVHIL